MSLIKYEAKHGIEFTEERSEDLVDVRGEMGVAFWFKDLLGDQIFSS
jgi:hypothetical protein